MSWPSTYGYKYTPIGLRQREVRDEQGGKTFSTTVHMPEGGHLLDIERRYTPDGSVTKKETNSFVPSSYPSRPSARAKALSPARASTPFMNDFEPRPTFADLERQADDIIANFRARQLAGLEPGHPSTHEGGRKNISLQKERDVTTPGVAGKALVNNPGSYRSMQATVASSLSKAEEETTAISCSSRQRRRLMRSKMNEDF